MNLYIFKKKIQCIYNALAHLKQTKHLEKFLYMVSLSKGIVHLKDPDPTSESFLSRSQPSPSGGAFKIKIGVF